MNEYSELSEARHVFADGDTEIPGLYLLGRVHNLRAGSPIPEHFHRDKLEFTLVAKGEQLFNYNKQSYTLNAGDYFISRPNEIHGTADSPEGRSELFWFQLDFNKSRFLTLNESDTARIKEKLLSVKNFGRLPAFDQDLICNAFEAMASSLTHLASANLLLLLERLCVMPDEKQFPISEQISRAQEYILDNIYDPISLFEVAQHIGLSLSRFKGRFKAETGVTPHEFIMFEKIRVAKVMLKSGKSVTSTAFDVGFSSSNYFATVFKKYTSFAPFEYARSKRDSDSASHRL